MYKKIVGILICMQFIGTSFTIMPIITSNVKADITNGLAGYWNFDEGSGTIAHDSSGNGNDGIIHGNALWVDGVVGKAVRFDRIDDYITVPDSNSLDITDAITLSVWVNLDVIDGFHPIISKGPTSGIYGYFMGTGSSYPTCKANFQLYPSSGTNTLWLDSIDSITSGTWYHLAATLSGTTGKVYINGLMNNLGSWFNGPIQSTNYSLDIGAHYYYSSLFKGLIDEIRIYNRALSESEILNLYNQGPENNPPNTPSRPSGPPAGWVGTLIEFSTSATDPDNDQIKYGWDWNADNTIDEWTGLYPSGNICTKRHQWDETGTYYIKVKAMDSNGAVSGWSDTKTIQIIEEDENQPPNIPSNPSPIDNAVDVDINTNLSWTGGDPDVDDTVTYDVYFGSMPPFQKIASNISTTTINPGTLSNGLIYFWNVVVWDNNDASTVGPSWHFTTINIINNPPNKPSKPVGETNGTKWVKYLYTTNTTDPDGDQVYYLWDWGDDSFSTWLGPYESGGIVDTSNAWAEGTYNIRVKAKDIYGLESDWSESLEISMPKNKAINTPLFLQKLFQRFPFFEKILKQDYN